MTRQETLSEYLILAEGILAIYRGRDIDVIYPQLKEELHTAVQNYQRDIDPMELKRINLEIVQKLLDD